PVDTAGGAPLDPGQFMDSRTFDEGNEPQTRIAPSRLSNAGEMGIEYMLEGTNPNAKIPGRSSQVDVEVPGRDRGRPALKARKEGDGSGLPKVLAILAICVAVVAATAWFVLFNKH